jgi:hypothetical protein
MLMGSVKNQVGSCPRGTLPSSDTRWQDGQPMNVNHLGIGAIENISHSLSFRGRPM